MSNYLDVHTHDEALRDGQSAVFNLRWPFVVGNTNLHAHFSAGLHPWDVTESDVEQHLSDLEDKLRHESICMIGECGIDRVRGDAIQVQQYAFEKQLQMAARYHKPVIIHCVRAYDLLLPYGKSFAGKIPLIVHGFNKSPELGRQLVQHGFILSFGAALLKPEQSSIRCLREQQASFYLETDNSGVDISVIYARAAFLRNVTVEELKDVIFADWKKIIGNNNDE